MRTMAIRAARRYAYQINPGVLVDTIYVYLARHQRRMSTDKPIPGVYLQFPVGTQVTRTDIDNLMVRYVEEFEVQPWERHFPELEGDVCCDACVCRCHHTGDCLREREGMDCNFTERYFDGV